MTQILVVDDNPLIRKLLGVALSRHFSVCEAQDVVSGLACVLRHKPQIMFLDIMMPSAKEGLELLETLRQHPEGKNILVAMVSGHTDPETRALAFAKGADAFFSKPFNLSEIAHWANEHLAVQPGVI
jgi:CheY-like chemotaxis protein